MLVSGVRVRISLLGLAMAAASCGQAKPLPPAPIPRPTPAEPPVAVRENDAGVADAAPSVDVETDAGLDADAGPPEAAPVSACPSGMMLVDTSYCPRIERKCIDEEYSPQNKITICHKYSMHQRCLVPEERRRFCIDEYEYPNEKGAHPPWMVSWYDAQATCGSRGKRLCYESEWVAACEGPGKTPFPYGFSRDNAKCNIDNTWIKPNLALVYNKDPAVQQKELARLDQSAASGANADCLSGFGVHDMTGNFDEWVTGDKRFDDKSEWAGLKGGAWGHVRNACRPITTSHAPDFTYYFIAFRCCSDPPGSEPYRPDDGGVPEVEAGDLAPLPNPVDRTGPSATKVAREHWPRPKP